MFVDNYIKKVLEKKSHLCVGLDPDLREFPNYILNNAEEKYGKTSQGAAHAIYEFNKLVIDQVADLIPVVKPQLAYYEVYGSAGIDAFWKTVAYAHAKDLLVIADAKRGDIDSTSKAYAQAFFKDKNNSWQDTDKVDAVTVNPFLGRDGIDPFLEVAKENGDGVIVLVKTSNNSSGEYQDKITIEDKKSISDLVCDYIASNYPESIGKYGYSNIGAVVGATYPEQARDFRKKISKSLFLVPGIGKQGGDIEQLANSFNEDGLGAIISSSRAINYAYPSVESNDKEVKNSIRNIVIETNQLINESLRRADKLAW
ncbi:orotidine-5'-phosphate decarboxylase [Floricoccus penangensis]|uniref:orotidine-5'-phosphate decarboxylase n=1 Tax=Floricoccus penangensis TaxID=1859475 RepID=UPI00203DD569|nr:orotidine-5'-phosphate decarboxylase [Floricoccus penangensis]URZ86605.1 orotidine-5'-phosphate decarboxylase [Floricoccus penangensis]